MESKAALYRFIVFRRRKKRANRNNSGCRAQHLAEPRGTVVQLERFSFTALCLCGSERSFGVGVQGQNAGEVLSPTSTDLPINNGSKWGQKYLHTALHSRCWILFKKGSILLNRLCRCCPHRTKEKWMEKATGGLPQA